MASDWAKLLQEAVNDTAESVPKDFLNYQQVSLEWNRSFDHTRRLLAKLAKSGHVERKTFRVLTQNGVKATPYFRLNTKAVKKTAA